MNNDNVNNFKSSFFVAIFYLLLSITWIYFSDSAVKAISSNNNTLTLLQTYKGIFYVFFTSIILYFLVFYFLQKQSSAMKIIQNNQKRYEVAEKIGKVGAWEYSAVTKDVWVSAELKRLFGFCIESTDINVDMLEGCIVQRKRVHQALEDLLQSGTEYNLEFEIHPFDGSLPRILSAIAKVEYDRENKSQRVSGFVQDITEAKKKDGLMIIQSRHAAMGEMIGMIAHQWRQPLSVISMDMNNMLIDIELNDLKTLDVKNYAENVLKHTQNLSKTIDDFRNFFRPDKAASKVTIQEVLEETYAIIHESLTNNSITLKTSYLSESKVDIYPRELMQVFVNIFHNAKDVLLSNKINDAYIDVKVYEDEAYVITDISDNGLGIQEAVLSKIFDLYFSTKDEKSGTGLGLYMSKMIVEEHLHGKIEAFNINSGTCFRIKIPKILKKLV